MLESKPRADRWFFGFAGLWFVALTLVGFSPTFHWHSNPVPLPFHLIIHGVLYSTWILVFLCQTQLIATRRTAWQRRFGAISVLLLILMIPVGFYVVLVKTAAGLKSIDDAGRNANSFRVFAAQLGIRQPQRVGHKFNRRNVARSRMAAAHQLSRRGFRPAHLSSPRSRAMSDLSLEDQNEAERQTELIATNADLGPNQLKRFANAIVLLIKPASPSRGNFHALQGVAGGWGTGLVGEATSGFGVRGHAVTNAGVVGRSDANVGVLGESQGSIGVLGRGKAQQPGVFGHSESGVGVIGRSDTLVGVWGDAQNAEGVIGDSQNATGVLGRSKTGGTGVVGESATGVGVFGHSPADVGVAGQSDRSMGVWGLSKSDAGVQGESETLIGVVGFGNDGYGVLGFSDGNAGVVGRSERSVGVWGDVQNDFGVLGTSNRSAGVAGYSQSSEGVHGESAADVGVKGFSQGVIGVFGESPNGLGILGRSLTGAGVTGQSNAATGVFGGSNAGPGVSGESTTDVGVLGRSPQVGVLGEGANKIGVYGRSGNGIGVRGHSAGGVGVLGSVSDPKALAGHFKGNVLVDGDFTVTGAKGAVVPHPDGSHRLFCAIESPESWFEDFGEGTIEGGRTEITLDPDFVQLVHADRYHVFLTPYGPTSGLYVEKRTAYNFVVREQQEGRSHLPFSYRVVAKRRDIDVPRLKKMPAPPEVFADVRGADDGNESGAAPETQPQVGQMMMPPKSDHRRVASPRSGDDPRQARLSIEKPRIDEKTPRNRE